MDQQAIENALRTILGDGYDIQKDATGGDMHVMGAPEPKRKASRPKGSAGFKKVEYITKAAPPKEPGQRTAKVGEALTTAGAVGGVASLQPLASHTAGKMREAGMNVPQVPKMPKFGAANEHIAGGMATKLGGFLKPVADVGQKTMGAIRDNPKVGAGVAAGAAGLEVAGLAGDFMARHSFKNQQQVQKSDDTIIFSKVDAEKRQVFGWCSISKKDGVDVVDLQGDIVPVEEIEKSAYDYMLASRKGGNQHERVGDEARHVSDCIESMVFTPEKIEKMGLPESFPQGWWVGFKIHDDDTWDEIKSGKRAGFSIHGSGKREVAKSAKQFEQHPITYAVDRKEQIKDIGLGAAGATAAGAGAGAGLLGNAKIAAKAGMTAAKADKVAGKLKVIGAVTGGTAGVYGGIHAMHEAAKVPPTRPVKKAWTPEVAGSSSEQKRMKRAKGYQQSSELVGVGAGASAGFHQMVARHKMMQAKKLEAESAAAQKKADRADINVRSGEGKRAAADARNIAAGKAINVSDRSAKAGEAAAKTRIRAAAHAAHARALLNDANNLRATALRHKSVSAKGTLVGVAAAATAAGIHHKRQGDWKPYR